MGPLTHPTFLSTCLVHPQIKNDTTALLLLMYNLVSLPSSPARAAHPTWLRCQPATRGQQSAWWKEPYGTEEYTSNSAKVCVPSTTSYPPSTSAPCKYWKTRPWTGGTKRWELQHKQGTRFTARGLFEFSQDCVCLCDRSMLSSKKISTKPQSSFLKRLTMSPSLLPAWLRFIKQSFLTGLLSLWRWALIVRPHFYFRVSAKTIKKTLGLTMS